MEIGQLRHRIELQQPGQATTDGMGGSASAWVTAGLCYAAVQPLSGREFFQAQQTQSTVTHKVTIRYRPGVTSAFRVVFEGRVFTVTGVIDTDERHEYLTLMCRDGQPNG